MAALLIGDSLRAARGRAGWSREALADHSGLSCAAIAQIESGRRQDVRLATIAALAEALGVSIDYLAGSVGAAGPQLLEHRAFIYESDRDYLATVVPFLRDGVRRGDAVLAVTTNLRTRQLRTALGKDAGRVEFRSSAGWYRSPMEALRKYRAYMEQRLDGGARWIRLLGEPIWTGRSDAEIQEWIRYEAIINLSLAAAPATVMCPYQPASLSPTIVGAAHRTHPELASGAGVTPCPAYLDPEAVLLSTP